MRTPRAAVFLGIGFVFIGTAFFAEFIGLDKDPGWGKVRIGMLFLGIASLSLAYYTHAENARLLIARFAKYWFAIPAILLVLSFYIWFVGSGRWNNWKSPTYYYADLADAFLHGNLYLAIKPDPQLLELKNPYDPAERVGVETPVDLSLYNGKFYMYWGPVPAVVPATIQIVSRAQMGDLILDLVFACGLFLIESLILLFIWIRYFPTLPQWTLYLSIILCGLVSPLILLRHNYDNARIYEAAISAGQFFLLAGFLMALAAIARQHISNWRLAAAGLLWVFAIGSRQVLAAPIGFMVMVTVWLLFQMPTNHKSRIVSFLALGFPFILGFAGLSWYNWARFGSIVETGLYYQLAGPNLREYYHELFSLAYSIQNLYNFLFNPIKILSKFPFVFMDKGLAKPILNLYSVPEFYTAQPIVGILYLFPFVIFGIISVIKTFFYSFKDKGVREKSNDPQQMKWILFSLGSSVLISFSLSTLFFWVGMRYTGDFMPALAIFCCVGFWQGYQDLEHKFLAKRFYITGAVILATVSIFLDILLAISTNSRLINSITRIFPILR